MCRWPVILLELECPVSKMADCTEFCMENNLIFGYTQISKILKKNKISFSQYIIAFGLKTGIYRMLHG